MKATAKILSTLLALAAFDAGAVDKTVEYYHTDALGSPVAVTASNRLVIERRDYEPYGRQLLPTQLADGPGYTGHVSDAATGLSYMQQRYYDPLIPRFLSVDPVTAYDDPIGAFHRYRYANNNPYKFTDPNGRSGRLEIRSSGTTGLGSHSWIVYTPDGGKPTTYGTWGNNPTGRGNGLFTNLEAGRSSDASRAMHLNDKQEATLNSVISSYASKGEDAWKLGEPCSTFASDAWNQSTGEHLDATLGPISNPTTLTESIISANGGKSDVGNVTSPARTSSSSASSGSSNSSNDPSSSSALSGPSINPLNPILNKLE
jgi:RHS repeat-associated protein